MQPIEIPKFPTLHGENAIKALHDFINELEEQKSGELTEKQTRALIKFAEGLISSLEVEIRSEKAVEEMRYESRFKKTIVKYIPESVNRLLGR